MSGAPVPPAEYDGKHLDTDDKLRAAGWAAGLDVWEQVSKGYADYLSDETLSNAQLWSLQEAIRRQATAEADADLRALAEGLLNIAEQAMPGSFLRTDSRVQLARTVLDRLTPARYSVLYDDPTRQSGPSHSLHATGCNHLRRATDPHAAQKLKAATLTAALVEAQYQGLPPSDRSDLGDVAVAPCAKRISVGEGP